MISRKTNSGVKILFHSHVHSSDYFLGTAAYKQHVINLACTLWPVTNISLFPAVKNTKTTELTFAPVPTPTNYSANAKNDSHFSLFSFVSAPRDAATSIRGDGNFPVTISSLVFENGSISLVDWQVSTNYRQSRFFLTPSLPPLPRTRRINAIPSCTCAYGHDSLL